MVESAVCPPGLMTHADGVVPRTLSMQRSDDTNDSAFRAGAYRDHNLTYTIPANFLKQGRALRITAYFRVTTGSSVPTLDIQPKAGNVVLAHFTPNAVGASITNNQFPLQWILQALDAPGAAANVEAAMLGNSNNA